MNSLFAVLAGTAILAGPVVAGVVAPGLMTGLAESGVTVRHRHFEFNEVVPVHAAGNDYEVHVWDGDLYEWPLTTQVTLRGAILPPPSDADLARAIQGLSERYDLPILGYEVQRDGERIALKATVPAGLLANLSPRYHELLAKYEA